MKALSVADFRRKSTVEKINERKFGQKVKKSVILCALSKTLSQFPDNDRLSRRIRGYSRRKGSLSSAGGLQKAAPGGRKSALCYQQGI